MAHYVDGFVVPVPKSKLDAYRNMAQECGKIWKEYGALQFCECVADDVKPGKVTSFPMAVKLQKDETVIFSWITWPSREARDAAMKKVMADPRMQPEKNPMPFDGKRLIFGGFEMIVDQ